MVLRARAYSELILEGGKIKRKKRPFLGEWQNFIFAKNYRLIEKKKNCLVGGQLLSLHPLNTSLLEGEG